MATQNVFEKYGIKDVANVTIYRIDKAEEAYESQRTITAKSILKGAVELKTVYPFENGISIDEGFEAYVFKDANLITGVNYDCDDTLSVRLVVSGNMGHYTESGSSSEEGTYPLENPTEVDYVDPTAPGTAFSHAIVKAFNVDDLPSINGFTSETVMRDNETQRECTVEQLAEMGYTMVPNQKYTVTYTKSNIHSVVDEGSDPVTYHVMYDVTYEAVIENCLFEAISSSELNNGVYSTTGRAQGDPARKVGTHEYSYAEQLFMLFAKRQNLITKTGSRYQFADADSIITGLAFEDAYALSAKSTERVVVLGPAAALNSTTALPSDASWSINSYSIAEINEIMDNFNITYHAKAYDVAYKNYAELIVEDEMGYFNPNFLGTRYYTATKTVAGDFVENYVTPATYGKGKDVALANATMWGEDDHYSINDAIDALRQKQKRLDVNYSINANGIKGLYGGYKVTGQKIPAIGAEDVDTVGARYSYTHNGNNIVNGETNVTSNYRLASVLDALATMSYIDEAIGKEIEVDYTTDLESNRAVYVNAISTSISARSNIYLLHNKNYRQLSLDDEGVFTFTDKKGNKLFYQDKIFTKVEWLALVIIGNKGLIFVVNRHGDFENKKMAWMINENGYITDAQAEVCVNNGLIHTVDLTINGETFEATCEVKKMKVRKTLKTSNRYVPVLFLDTLKVSTLEQTAEDVYATGGTGNGNLIGWDFGKAITLTMQDALFTPASMNLIFGGAEGDLSKSVKEAKTIDRTEPVIAKRNFIVPAGNEDGMPSEADKTAKTVFLDPNTMNPYQDGTPIVEGERFLKWTRSVAYAGESIGKVIEISADKFPGTYKVVGETYIRSKSTGKDERFQFSIPQAKMGSDQTITLEADGEPSVFDMNMQVLRPDDGVMVRFIQFDVVENEIENDGSTMVKNTENLNLLDDAELFKVSGEITDGEDFIGATEY